MRTSLSMRPSGWFQVGWSTTVPERGVVGLRYFGQDLVAWRDETGTVHVMDAYCQHLGASLAHGGAVTPTGIQCPFHGWTWDADGRNVSIPYQDRPNTARRIRTWRVVERDDVLFLWHDAAGREPWFEVPDLATGVSEHLAGRAFSSPLPDGTAHFRDLQVHPQYVIENAVDLEHFRFVHGTGRAPVVLVEDVGETTWHTVAGFGRRWADGVDRPDDRMGTITIHWVGIGFAYNAELTADGWRVVLIATTPVDEDTTEMFGTYWLEETAGSSAGDRARRLAEIAAALPQDLEIWNHQVYLDPPALATSEGAGFRRLRRWSERFYPEGEVSPSSGRRVPAPARSAESVG